MSDGDNFDEYEEREEGSEWCDRCQGLGTADCYCGGDQCYCENYGEIECPQCNGEGYWTPTEKQLADRAENAVWWRGLWQSLEASADTHPKDGDGEAAPVVSGAVPQGDAPNSISEPSS